MRVLIDSDILIEVSRGRDIALVSRRSFACRPMLRWGAGQKYLRRYRKSHSVELGDAFIAARAGQRRTTVDTES